MVHNDELHGRALLSSKLRGIKALVVLDDVDSIAQLEALYDPLCSSLGPKSVILITSRNQAILQHAQSSHIFELHGLSEESSQRLFNWHAFLKPEAPPELKEVSKRVVNACQGLPLSLKVVGTYLFHNIDERYWHESLDFFRRNKSGVLGVLRKSLDGLERDERDSFLDICCFFVGQNDILCRAYLEGVYGVGLTHLKLLHSRCLLTFDKEEGTFENQWNIGMHDHLRDMGRQVVREEEKNRAWDEETAKHFLKDERTRSTLRGLSINSAMPLPEEAAKLKLLPELSFLRVIHDSHDSESLPGNNFAGNVLKNVRCDELRLLGWRDAPFRQLPPGLCSTNLRVLDLRDSNISELPRAPFINLRYLDVAGTNISEVPGEVFSRTLEYIDLSGTKISELPSVVCCPNLRQLHLLGTQISQVPHGLCSTVLEILGLSGTNISNVPVGQICCDRTLKLIKEAYLPKLVNLDLICCEELRSLPATFRAFMPSLKRLSLEECECLEALDSSIGSLTNLTHLWLSKCHRMTGLPQEIIRVKVVHQQEHAEYNMEQ
ncbi:hypothetical protein KP509_1Z045800 [Ceratopteris richardii]|nr:hypothetical protein KP509_1Z045800 [Ceratopteris richardii]